MAWDPKSPEPCELPAGLAGMVAHENRLLNDPRELLSAEGVAMDDLLIRKEPGLTAYDTAGLQLLPAFRGVWTKTAAGTTASESIGGILATFPAAVAGTAPAVGGTAAQGNSSGNFAVSVTVPAGGYAINTLVVLAVTHAALTAGAGNGVITDTGANTWTLVEIVDLISDTTPSVLLYLYYSKLTTGLVAGNTITATYLTSGENEAVTTNFTGTGATHDLFASTSQQFTGLSQNQSVSTLVEASTALPTVPQLLVGALAVSQVQTAGTLAFQSAFIEDLEVSAGTGADLSAGHRIDITSDVLITALTDWYSDEQTTPAGTVSTTSGSTTVTGVGTTFTAHAPGDRIVISNDTRIIESITSNTSLEVTTEWTTTYAGQAYAIRVGNRLITATSGGNLFKEKPISLTTGDLDAVTLKSGLAPIRRPGRFVAAGKEAAAEDRKLFYFNGVDPVQVLSGDGTSTTDLALPPADWDTVANQGEQPINGVVHQNRLVAFGNLNDPHRAYFSDPDDHEDFSVANTDTFDIGFRSDIGDRLYCGLSYQGILFFWKFPRGIFYLDDTSLTATEWLIRSKSESLGCAPSPYAALSVDDDVLFIDPNAHFHLLSAVDVLGGARASDIILHLGLSRWIRENVNLKKLEQVVSYWYPQKKLAVFYLPGTDEDENTIAIKFDFSGRERDLPVKVSFSRRDAAGAAAVRRASDGGPETPVIGEGEFVWLGDQEARTKNGLGYTMRYRLPNLDLAHVHPVLRQAKKLPEFLELIMEPVPAGTLNVTIYVDGVATETLTFDATKTRDKQKLHVGAGWTISAEVENSVAGEDCKVLSHVWYYKLGDESYSYGERGVTLGDA